MAFENEVIRDIYTNLGLPPQRVLPLTIVVPKIHEQLKFRGLQSRLSDQNYALKVSPAFNPGAQDIAVPAGWAYELGAEAIVEICVDLTNDTWDPVEIVNKADLAVYERSGRLAVAFYGDPARMCFSWNPADDGDSIRVSYDESIVIPGEPSAAIPLKSSFAPMIAVDVAIECIPDLEDRNWKSSDALQRRLEVLLRKASQWAEEWKVDRFSSSQQGATSRLPFNRGRPGWRSTRWRR